MSKKKILTGFNPSLTTDTASKFASYIVLMLVNTNRCISSLIRFHPNQTIVAFGQVISTNKANLTSLWNWSLFYTWSVVWPTNTVYWVVVYGNLTLRGVRWLSGYDLHIIKKKEFRTRYNVGKDYWIKRHKKMQNFKFL